MLPWRVVAVVANLAVIVNVVKKKGKIKCQNFRKKTVIIDAFQYDGDFKCATGQYYVPYWAVEAYEMGNLYFGKSVDGQLPFDLYVRMPNNDIIVPPGYFVIKDDSGSIYPCTQNVFGRLYDLIDENQSDYIQQ